MKEMLLDVMTLEEQQEYSDLLVLNKFYSMINEIIDIDIETAKQPRGYYFDAKKGKYRVRLTIDGTVTSFGLYETEQEAINRVIEIRGGNV